MRRLIFNKQYFKDARRVLRKDATKAEFLLWFELRNNKLGCRFKRQESIGRFIVDFYCPKKELVIELDGQEHKNNHEYDNERTQYLSTFGIVVIRFWNYEVEKDIENVVSRISRTLSCI